MPVKPLESRAHTSQLISLCEFVFLQLEKITKMWLLQCDKYHFSNVVMWRKFFVFFILRNLCESYVSICRNWELTAVGQFICAVIIIFFFSWESGYLFVISALVKFISLRWQWWHLKCRSTEWFFVALITWVRPKVFCGFINIFYFFFVGCQAKDSHQ